MRLYLFRSTPDIPIEGMGKIAETVGRVLNIDYSIFTGPVSGTVEQISIEHLLGISDRFLERGEPIVAIAFTREGVIDDEDILGEGSQPNRGAWVKWNDNIKQITLTTLHELGHLCEAEHCSNESCIMFHTYREHSGTSMNDLLCDKCRITLQNSWVYNRLVRAAEDRAKKNQRLPKIVNSTSAPPLSPAPLAPRQHTPVNRTSLDLWRPPFPDWSLAKSNREEFVRRVMEHFGYRRG